MENPEIKMMFDSLWFKSHADHWIFEVATCGLSTLYLIS